MVQAVAGWELFSGEAGSIWQHRCTTLLTPHLPGGGQGQLEALAGQTEWGSKWAHGVLWASLSGQKFTPTLVEDRGRRRQED